MRELQACLEERQQVRVSPGLIRAVTAEVLEEVQAWQARLLEPCSIAVACDDAPVRRPTSCASCAKAFSR